MKNYYGNKPPSTKAGSHVENAMGKGMILLLAASPLLILATGNPAGLLALPLLLFVPLAFTETKRKSELEFRQEAIASTQGDDKLMSLSPKDLARELCKESGKAKES